MVLALCSLVGKDARKEIKYSQVKHFPTPRNMQSQPLFSALTSHMPLFVQPTAGPHRL
jgi:hypothetical protein